MRTIYLDNYKGFKNTYHHILDANFFVGENSTGKTSVLKLINLITHPVFNINPEFNIDNIELGYFNEIINQYSENDTFSIGAEYQVKSKGKNVHRFILMRFKNDRNTPKLFEYREYIGENDILINISNKCITVQNSLFSGEKFQDWIENKNYNPTKKKINDLPKGQNIPLVHIRALAFKAILNNENTEENIYFPSRYLRTVWLAPMRAKPKRTYEAFSFNFSSEGDHMPILLRELLKNRKKNQKHGEIK